MAMDFGTIASATATDTTSLTIAKPTNLAEGDTMTAIIATEFSSTRTDWALSGWTLKVDESGASELDVDVLFKIAEASDVSATDFTFTTSNTARNVVGAIVRGVGTDPSDATEVDSDSATATTTPSYTGGVTPVVADSLLIMAVATENTPTVSGYAIANNNPIWTERLDTSESSGTGGAGASLAIATAQYAATTTTGAYSATISSSLASVGVLVAVQESSSVTVSPSVITATASVQAPSVSGGANVSPSVISATASVQAPTVTTPAAKWSNTDKSDTSPTITNTDKS